MRRQKQYKRNRISKHIHGRYVILAVCIVAIAVGVYVLFLTLVVPRIPLAGSSAASSPTSRPAVGNNRLYIPKIGVDVPINTGGPHALDNGIWHRHPNRGNPVKGGNFILAGHRFEMGLGPWDVLHKSPLYNINKLNKGNQILVDFSGQRYSYKVSKIYSVKPNAIQIEDPSPNNPHMTLYSCTLGGSADGRIVIDAKLAGRVKFKR